MLCVAPFGKPGGLQGAKAQPSPFSTAAAPHPLQAPLPFQASRANSSYFFISSKAGAA